ncbi:MAG: NAD-glutamate dehydrogenase domain-containing protein [Acidobacteriota bacterium]
MGVTLREIQSLIEDQAPESEAALLQNVATVIFEEATTEFLDQFDEKQLLAITRGALALMNQRRDEPVLVRAYNPVQSSHGWEVGHTALDVTLGDRPFIVDTVRLLLKRRRIRLHHLLHPILSVERNEAGSITAAFLRQSDSTESESYELFLIDRIEDPDLLHDIQLDLKSNLELLIAVTDDYQPMRAKAAELEKTLLKAAATAGGPRVPESAASLHEYAEFVRWLDLDNFVFLGYREYEVTGDAAERSAMVKPESGLGILRNASRSRYARPAPVSSLPEKVRQQMQGPPLVIVAKANSESPVHRSGLMDYIGLKEFDESGRFVGERRFLGLFTSHAYATPVTEIPILRHKLRRILELDHAKVRSHDFKQIVNICNSIPLGELFLLEAEELHRGIRDLMSIERERGVRLQIRLDPLQRGFAVMVIMPRERFNSDVRARIQEFLATQLRAVHVDYRLAMVGDDDEQVRFHFFFSTSLNYDDLDFAALEGEVAQLTRTWDDLLQENLQATLGEGAIQLVQRYSHLLSEGYKAEVPIEDAALDIQNLEKLGRRGFLIDLINPKRSRYAEETTHLRIYHPGTLALTEVFPILDNLGLKIFEQISYLLRTEQDRPATSIDIFRVQQSTGRPIDIESAGQRVNEALVAILTGGVRDDRLNRLVLGADLSIREVALLSTYRGHMFQLLPATSLTFITDTLLHYPHCVAKILAFFRAKFEGGSHDDRAGRMATAKTEALQSLDEVSTLPEDNILRFFTSLVDATVRTNFFLGRPYISIKVESRRLNRIPEPRPHCEIFVSSPEFEAIHLRGGRIARGGLRWSDRPDDFRTEVLGLMKTQMTKNSLIVPVGSKGGFVLKKSPTDPAELKGFVQEQYKTFIRGLLDLTDNIRDGQAVHPEGLIVYDDQDPYLVVAADKGTATFSDIANSVSQEYNFWLGDAFASGGSHGYDHKREAITARGAWECVTRHLREMGLDPLRDEFTVAGIGDMSGDVFGNGMLYTDKIRLVAAFNHTHIFVDPDPDAAAGFAERKRLFENPSLSWDDYDPGKLSEGGGIFPRGAKAIPLSPQIRTLLGVEDESVSGQEMIRKILRLPVDLLWNGGIGTYVKSSSEASSDVGDPANNTVRIDATELRARVVGEGGNLGLTQLARIEYAQLGGRINTDAIDNSGGVDMSDHEVNIKILLEPAVRSGQLPFEQRNSLLGEMTSEVSGLVLRNNYSQALCLSLAEQLGTDGVSRLESLQHFLSQDRLNPEVEFLPSSRTLELRRRNHQSYTRPELAILLAYTKMSVKEALRNSELLDEAALERHLFEYFPINLRERFAGDVRRHQLRREIIATRLTNLIVDRLGITFINGIAEDTEGQPSEVLRAVLVTHEILELDRLFDRIFELDAKVAIEAQYQAKLRLTAAAKNIVHLLVLGHDYEGDFGTLIDRYRDPIHTLRSRIDEFLPAASERKRYLQRRREAVETGFTDDLAADLAASDYWASCMGVADICRHSGVRLEKAARRFYAIGDVFSLGWLRDELTNLKAPSRWEAVAVGGLVMDLRHAQRQLTIESFRRGLDDRSWRSELFRSEGRMVERISGTVSKLQDQRAVDLASGSVVTRLLLQLLRSLESRRD